MGSLHLVRHGQASFGTDDYDRLSEQGKEQSVHLGQSWEAGGWSPTQSIAGSMLRHAQTAIASLDAIGGEGYDVDLGWNEYDHIGIATAMDESALSMDSRAFQKLLNVALQAWREGDGEFTEPYAAFRDRVMTSFRDALDRAGSGQRVVVFTSGGPIAMILSQVLVGDDSIFQRLNDVIVNASVTTIINGSTGPRALTFNEHTHLPRDLVTYR